MPGDDPLRCAHCGRVVDQRDLHVRFGLPDPVLDVPEDRRADWRNTGDFLIASEIGVFVRVLLPVRLTHGYQITYGAWMSLGDEEAYHRTWRLWDSEEYPSLVIDGVIANAIEPWGPPMMSLARAVVREVDQLPYVDLIRSSRVAEVVTEVWPRDWVLSAVPHAAWHE